jgi:N utilization substance protein B
MISRRNIRIKVMQTLYSFESAGSGVEVKQADIVIKIKLEQTVQLFTYLVYLITEVARYAETDSLKRSSKHLPTEQDLQVNTKISGNTLIWQVLEDVAFKSSMAKWHFESTSDQALIKHIYTILADSEEYDQYIKLQSREKQSERDILSFIFNKLMLPDDNVMTHLEELFIHWDDDGEMIQLMIQNFLHKPASYDFANIISLEKRQFASTLLSTTIEKKEHCLDLIRPKLKNWDADRIAQLDMIIMRLGLCELLYFETIPAKVTINEYIDIAKDYSTPQSGQFVNGILDSIHKEIELQGNLHKVEYKK